MYSQAFRLAAMCLCLTVFSGLAGCAGKMGGKGAEAPVNPNDKEMAYGVTLSVPKPWEVAVIMPPEKMSREALEQKRKSGERVLLMAAVANPGSSGIENMFSVFLVNQENTFMPKEFAEKLQPQEFTALSRDLFEREKATAKKNKTTFSIMDLQLARETVNNSFAVSHKATIASPQGAPLRSLRWDVYMPEGAGIAILADFDGNKPGAEQEVINMVRSLRVK
ncbi:hypothetical protein LJB81_01520 [Desulfovibrio sp. OttesenSCG-928-M14]|nr:hypothetical protein [Desulfovibrio sp. OttesenSCG-928-M14]